MKVKHVLLFLIATTFVVPLFTDEQHTHNNDEHNNEHNDDGRHNKEKYYVRNIHHEDNPKKFNKWQPYLDTIQKAVLGYDDCTGAKCYLSQRKSDFRYWVKKGGITQEDFERGQFRNLGEHYQILNHRLYRQHQCVFPARCSGNEHFILKIIHKLPDMEFIINSHDWPKVDKHRAGGSPSPVFSFSKTPREMDILYPAWSFWEGGPAVWPIYPQGLGRWDLMSEDMGRAAEKWTWNKKENKGFFRGSRTSSERDPLILLSRKNERLVDAQYTKNQGYKSKADTLGEEPVKEIPLNEHCKYKYLFNFRGIAASFRLKYLFLCHSAVFHVGHEWIEFFYGAMKPWVHYIPLSVQLHEVEEMLEFAHENDQVLKEMADRGAKFIKQHLQLADVQDYWYKILNKYAKLATWKPVREENFVEIKKKQR